MPKKTRVQVIDSVNVFQGKILFELRKTMDLYYRRAAPAIQLKVRLVIARGLQESDTVGELLGGTLALDFGLTPSMAKKAVADIVHAISQGVNVDFKQNSKNSVGSLFVNVVPVNFSHILTANSASYISPQSESEIHWLEWLLTRGSEIVVGGWHVETGFFANSRSGFGVMAEGGDFRVDPQHAGTVDDNFITRTVKNLSDEIIQIIKSEIKKI